MAYDIYIKIFISIRDAIDVIIMYNMLLDKVDYLICYKKKIDIFI